MWTVVYIAPNRTIANNLKDAFEKEGLLVMLRSANIPYLGDTGNIEVLVPESEIEEAHEILQNVLTS